MNKLLETTSGEVNVCVCSQSHITPTWWRKGKMKHFCLNSIEYIQWWLGEDRCSIYQTISNAHIIVGFSTPQLISSTKFLHNLEYVLNFTNDIGWSHSSKTTFYTNISICNLVVFKYLSSDFLFKLNATAKKIRCELFLCLILDFDYNVWYFDLSSITLNTIELYICFSFSNLTWHEGAKLFHVYWTSLLCFMCPYICFE